MKSRVESLGDLIRLAAPLAQLRKELRQHEWTSPAALVVLDAHDIVRILDRFVKGELKASAVEEWADALELREDVGFASDTVREALFDLANPVLQGPLTVAVAARWISRLSDR